MYTCTICLSLNHNARLHCQNCGAVPAKYSISGSPSIIAAKGCDRQERHHTSRCNLKTVTLDYYAEGGK